MTVLTFPRSAEYLGGALDPSNPIAGLTKAVAIVGEARVRSIAETLLSYNGVLLDRVLSVLSATWYTDQPMRPAIDHLRELGSDAVVRAMAASLFARVDGGGFNLNALDAIAPGVRALSGLPTRTEIDKARLVADALRDSAP